MDGIILGFIFVFLQSLFSLDYWEVTYILSQLKSKKPKSKRKQNNWADLKENERQKKQSNKQKGKAN